MAPDPLTKALATGRVGRLATMARTGLGTARSIMSGSADGLEVAVERLGELRGLGTKVGQMAGLLEASLPPDVREKVGPALARLRAQAARSPFEAVAKLIEDELGAPPEQLFLRFDPEPFASASLGQVHEAIHHDGRRLAVKVQHPGIEHSFAHDLQNVGLVGRMATSFIMPSDRGKTFITGVQQSFLVELDYVREAGNLLTFSRLVADDPDLDVPELIADRSSARVLTTSYLRGEPVEGARAYDSDTRKRQAAAIRRIVISSPADHGWLYADSHAGNFLFREDGTVGVLDFGSVLRLDQDRCAAFTRLRDAALGGQRAAFGRAVADLLSLDNRTAAEAIADIQWIAIGGLVRGDAISADRVRQITTAAAEMNNDPLSCTSARWRRPEN